MLLCDGCGHVFCAVRCGDLSLTDVRTAFSCRAGLAAGLNPVPRSILGLAPAARRGRTCRCSTPRTTSHRAPQARPRMSRSGSLSPPLQHPCTKVIPGEHGSKGSGRPESGNQLDKYTNNVHGQKRYVASLSMSGMLGFTTTYTSVNNTPRFKQRQVHRAQLLWPHREQKRCRDPVRTACRWLRDRKRPPLPPP